jgi:aminoglycoside phosphotransferase (APT) family kinase protein
MNFLELLRNDGIVKSPDATLTPLTGGVSSEIYRVDDGRDVFVVKRALAKLKVREDWFADVGRNRYERAFLEYVRRFLPGAVPALRDSSDAHGYFTMEYLAPEFANWKQLLLAGCCRREHAVLAARLLSTIHRRSAGDGEAARSFDTTSNFRKIRIEPYLLTTASRHPKLRSLFEAESERLEATRECLVHGDFSPKNILIHGGRMVLLDCEVAWYGDPAFDTAFGLNHLFLKALHCAPQRHQLQNMISDYWETYLAESGPALDRGTMEERTARLLLMLMLARVDGKSPVEYLSCEHQEVVRDFVSDRLPRGPFRIAPLAQAWISAIKIQP